MNITRVSTGAPPYLVPYYAGGSSGWKRTIRRFSAAIGTRIPVIISRTNIPRQAVLSLQGSQYEEPEKIYRKFVHEYYVDCPKTPKSPCCKRRRRAGLNADDPEIVEKVAKLVQRTVEYDLSFEEYEDDFAVYFFTKARKGICQHYATAVDGDVSALGIPARYVTGFVRD